MRVPETPDAPAPAPHPSPAPDAAASPGFAAAVSRARDACRETAARLDAAGVAREFLAEYVAPRRRFLVMRPAVMQPIGEVWRVGSLLLSASGELHELGHATRAAERGRPGYQSASREERREIAAAALRGGYAIGEAVNYDARPIPLDEASAETRSALSGSGPVGFDAGEVRVRWRAGAPLTGAPTLASFLAERADLLISPPFSGE
ncbi:hypothetical protein SAMN04488565_2649 [Leucobacter chromiiresistens]|uniref:Glutaminase n=2 Tax=Leucobacter chromiiresistens TaxID=1079994 RepID=A0A1H1B8F6_9MICO|nr:hypothetical protein SAMN04488565_2649 [Leucobacter chromiiresistens]